MHTYTKAHTHTHTHVFRYPKLKYPPSDALVCKCNLRPRAEIKTKIELWAAIRMERNFWGQIEANKRQTNGKKKTNNTKDITYKNRQHTNMNSTRIDST